MLTSDNGWPGISNVANTVLTEVPGVGLKIRTAGHGVDFLFSKFIQRFDKVVEPVRGPTLDDWSWAYRMVRDSTTSLSCHASGTAVDLNALQHPRSVRNTFNAAKLARLRGVLAEFEDPKTGLSIFKWGGDFHTTVDDMHYQIQGDLSAVSRVVTKIKAQEAAAEEMNLKDTVTLTTQFQVDSMNVNIVDPAKKYRLGDTLTVERMLFWGGPGVERLFAHIRGLEASIKALTEAVNAK